MVAGAVICSLGTVGVAYFQLDWGGSSFWRWFPVSVIAVGIGVLLMFASLIFGFIRSFAARFRRRHEKRMP